MHVTSQPPVRAIASWHACLRPIPCEDELHFTPDLVVPQGCECVLLVCAKPKRGMTYDVIDSGGGVVLQMEDVESTPMRRTLLTPSKVLLGQCTRTRSHAHPSSLITYETPANINNN